MFLEDSLLLCFQSLSMFFSWNPFFVLRCSSYTASRYFMFHGFQTASFYTPREGLRSTVKLLSTLRWTGPRYPFSRRLSHWPGGLRPVLTARDLRRPCDVNSRFWESLFPISVAGVGRGWGGGGLRGEWVLSRRKPWVCIGFFRTRILRHAWNAITVWGWRSEAFIVKILTLKTLCQHCGQKRNAGDLSWVTAKGL